ncbi:hypothetical protein L1765_08620 [Microaerobacter geothermalis]|uniref:hypothetical protein n=1 Tax=Microaerobacter geothermalis TaxID=674972 RepID=UPI001F2ECCAA|nr:hypothetical protein [Microaerobacter geothermalis]MCF6094031.1 hypothetical protein [Microaerobacter geothermalis]
MECPICQNKYVGEITPKRYFCAHCCIEIEDRDEKLVVYHITEDGNTVRMRVVHQTAS